ncbi:MAG TPA: hypothetical protein VF398_06710, partial [bacterium]
GYRSLLRSTSSATASGVSTSFSPLMAVAADLHLIAHGRRPLQCHTSNSQYDGGACGGAAH